MFFRELNRGNRKTYLPGCEPTRRAVLIDLLKESTGRDVAAGACQDLDAEPQSSGE